MAVPSELISSLTGDGLSSLDYENSVWCFRFNSGAALTTSGPWRILGEGRIAFADCDHCQLFGLSDPFDCVNVFAKTIAGQRVQSVTLRQDTGDITISAQNAVIEIFNPSAAHEGWNLRINDKTLIALGGGELCVF